MSAVPTQRSPRLAEPSAAALSKDGPLGQQHRKNNTSNKADEQGRPLKAQRRIRGGMAKGREPRAQSFSVTDGTITVGRITRYGDQRNWRWLALNTRGSVLGAYATMDAAISRLAEVRT